MREGGVGGLEFVGDGAGFEGQVIDFANGSDFGGGAREEDFLEPFDFLRFDPFFFDRDAHILCDFDNGLARQAV